MKKAFKFYSAIWFVLFVLFNVIAFVSVGWAGIEKFTPSFWIGYIFITVAFIGQIICTYFALKDNDLKKTFYNISLISTSYTGLILSFIFGGLCMIISPLPYWVGIILCAIVLGFNVIAVVKATAAIDIVSGIDEKVKESTLFIKSLTVDAENLISRAKTENIKAECKKVYEAVRYSDPMSNDALASIEGDITIKFSKLSEAVISENSGTVVTLADEIIILLGDRNKKCRLLK
ncbi:MAG: hypothetical protein ACI3YE_00555 [Candidatus Avispirillum sp.]